MSLFHTNALEFNIGLCFCHIIFMPISLFLLKRQPADSITWVYVTQITSVSQIPDKLSDGQTRQTDGWGRNGRWAAVTDILPVLCEPHVTAIPSKKSTTLVSAGCELPNPTVSLLMNRALNPNPLAKCKRGIRAHVKTAYSQIVCSERPSPIHGVIQSDSTLSFLLSDRPTHRSEEGWCLANVRERGVALC